MILRQLVILLVMSGFALAVEADSTAESFAKATSAVDNSDFKLAETILYDHLRQNHDDIEARFLYARVLSWQGKSSQALDQFNMLLLQHPDNADYLLSRANTYEWMGRRSQALDDLATARQISPEYKDVWRTEITLLTRAGDQDSVTTAANLAQQAKHKFPDDNWDDLLKPARADVNSSNIFSAEASYRYDHLTNSLSPWRSAMLRMDVQTPQNHFAHVRYDSIERFDLNDQQIGAGYALPVAESWLLYAAATYSPTHKVLPNRMLELRASKNLKNGFSLSAGVIHGKYTQTSSQQGLLTAEYYWSDYRAAYTYRIVDVLNAGTGKNHSIQFNKYFTAENNIGVGFSSGEDVEFNGTPNPPISDVVSFSIFGRYMYRPGWSLVYSYNYHEQGDLYIRNGVILGIRIDF